MNEENNVNSNEENNSLETSNTESPETVNVETKTVTTVEEVKSEATENKQENKDLFLGLIDKTKLIKILCAIAVVLLIALIIKIFVFKPGTSKNGVSKLLDTKYDSISCIDYDCNGFMAIEGDKLTKYKVVLFNVDGEKVADYKEVYNANLKETEVPYAIGKDFYLTSITSLSKLSASGYNMKNKKGKVIYSSEKSIELLNNYLVITTDKETSKKIIVDKKGKVLYSNISDYESYFNGKIIEIEIDNTYALLNELGEKFLSDYSISKIVKDEDEKYLYAVVKNEKDKVYNYFDLLKAKVVGDSFSSYSAGDEVGTLVITKKENEKSVKYLLTKDGKQTKLETEETTTSSDGFYKDFKDKVDTDTYSIFSGSLYSKDQENIIVNNKVEKSMGVYNVNTKEYKELYKYAQDKSYFYSSVYNVKNSDENGLVLRFICTTSCDQNESLVYDVKNNKELYRYEGENHITSYAEYENGYKVIGLSNSTDKYTVLDKDNKNLYSSKKVVLILDSELVLGDKPSYSAILYSSKDNKVINENTVSIIDDYKNMLYKYSDETNTYILDKDGKEIIKVNKNDYLKNIDNYYIYIANNKINIYDIDKNKTNSYTMKDSEKMNDASGSMISPYKQTLVINNSTEKYVKVINFNGKVLKKIDNVELSKFKTNDEAEKAFLIVKKTKNNKDLYGLYVYQ
ncbi:unknown [Firmicutes bacterium CAG:582]|nr:unknown [Firmicutes bacterium CAG:582]